MLVFGGSCCSCSNNVTHFRLATTLTKILLLFARLAVAERSRLLVFVARRNRLLCRTVAGKSCGFRRRLLVSLATFLRHFPVVRLATTWRPLIVWWRRRRKSYQIAEGVLPLREALLSSIFFYFYTRL